MEVTARETDFDPWEDATLVDSEGFVVHTIELEDAPDYVVPITFSACYDDPRLPVEVTLEIEVRLSAGVILRRVIAEPRPASLVHGSAWPSDGMSEYAYVGDFKVATPTLTRDALAHAAMPRSRPHYDEMGYHAVEVTRTLVVHREPRLSSYERDLMRHHYARALASPECTAKQDRTAFVHDALIKEMPGRWSGADWFRRLRPLS